MANDLDKVIPVLLAQGLMALRENSLMPRLVNTSYSTEAASKGNTINVPIPSAITVADVVPANIAPNPGDTAPTDAPIVLSNWKEGSFQLSDKDLAEAMSGIIPMQASEAIKAISNQIDQDLMSLYKDVYGFAGVPGATPFASSTVEATDTRKVLNKQLAPLNDRRFVLDADAEGNALNLRAFQDGSYSGDVSAIIDGKLNHKIGFDWFMDQNIPTHTVGTQNGAYVVNGVNALGATTLNVKTGTGTLTDGDILKIAGDTQTYVVTTLYTPGGAGAVSISPGLKVATTGDEAITVKGTASTGYAQNLAFHRDAFAFASRTLLETGEGLGHYMSAADKVSGLTLRLEVSREYKRTRYSYDILYGFATIRPELACRLWG